MGLYNSEPNKAPGPKYEKSGIGNDITKCFVDLELYDKSVFNFQSKPVSPRDAFSKTERKAISVTYVQAPTALL